MRWILSLVIVLAVSGCADGPGEFSGLEKTRRMAGQVFGPVNVSAVSRSGDARGLSMFRVFSEKPVPNRFSGVPPESFENALVMDVAVDMEIEKEFPLYRIGLRPRRLPPRRRDLWPSFVRVNPSSADTDMLVARLPRNRVPDGSGVIWTGWTYCPDCMALDHVERATIETREMAFSAILEARRAARRKNSAGSRYAGEVIFATTPGVGILQGRAARDMADKVSDIIRDARERLDGMVPARRDYDRAVADFRDGASPLNELVRLCGTYAPRREHADADDEARRFDAYHRCGLRMIGQFDRTARLRELSVFAAQEARLAKRAGLAMPERFIIPGLGEEIAAAHDAMDAARKRYRGVRDENVAQTAGEAPARAIGEDADPPMKGGPTGTGGKVGIDHLRDEDVLFVANLFSGGANMDYGAGGASCMADLECEIGSVIPLLKVRSYCGDEGGLTGTESGWGLIIQRYFPEEKTDYADIARGNPESLIHVVSVSDEKALKEGLARLRALENSGGERVFFTSYQSFYEINTRAKGCRDRWRDAADHRVANNPEEVVE